MIGDIAPIILSIIAGAGSRLMVVGFLVFIMFSIHSCQLCWHQALSMVRSVSISEELVGLKSSGMQNVTHQM